MFYYIGNQTNVIALKIKLYISKKVWLVVFSSNPIMGFLDFEMTSHGVIIIITN